MFFTPLGHCPGEPDPHLSREVGEEVSPEVPTSTIV